MKFFLDTAEIEDIKKAVELGICDGITTNPTLIMKSGRKHKEVIQDIARFVTGPISVESMGDTREEMVREAEEFSRWAENIVVKLPMTKEGLNAVRVLSKKGIKTNVTLVFSPAQALLAAKAGATYVSPFVGRLDDASESGMGVVSDILQIFNIYGFETKVIVASIRSTAHVIEAAKLGAHIATIPPKVFESLWHHPLTDQGIKLFKEHHEKHKNSVK